MLRNLFSKTKDKVTFKSNFNNKSYTKSLDEFDKKEKKELIKLTKGLTEQKELDYRDFLEYYNEVPEYIKEENVESYKEHIKSIFEGSNYVSDNISKYKETRLENVCKTNKKVLIIGTNTNSKVQTLKTLSNFGSNEFLVIQNYNQNFDANINIYKNEKLPQPLTINVIFKDDEDLIEKLTNNLAEKEITMKNIKKCFSECDVDYIINSDEIVFRKEVMELVDVVEQTKDLLKKRKREILKEMFNELSEFCDNFRFECIKGNDILLIENEDDFYKFDNLKCFNLTIKDYTFKEKIQETLNRIITSNLSFKSLTPLVYEVNIFELDNNNKTFKMKYGSLINELIQKQDATFLNEILYDFEIILTHSPKAVIEDDFGKILKLLIENGKINNTTLIIDEDIKESIKFEVARISDSSEFNNLDVDYKLKQISENTLIVESFRNILLKENDNNIFNQNAELFVPISKVVFSSFNYQSSFVSSYESIFGSLEKESLLNLHKDTTLLKTFLNHEFSKLFFSVINNNLINNLKDMDQKLSFEKTVYKQKNYLKEFLIKLESHLTDEILEKLNNNITSLIKKGDVDYKMQIIELLKSTVNMENGEINFYSIFIKSFKECDMIKDLNINIQTEK